MQRLEHDNELPDHFPQWVEIQKTHGTAQPQLQLQSWKYLHVEEWCDVKYVNVEQVAAKVAILNVPTKCCFCNKLRKLSKNVMNHLRARKDKIYTSLYYNQNPTYIKLFRSRTQIAFLSTVPCMTFTWALFVELRSWSIHLLFSPSALLVWLCVALALNVSKEQNMILKADY